MTSKAPGQTAPEQEPSCYNCGVKGHWAFACPEPTRDVPVGLQRYKEHGNHERGGPSRDRKGPIVTHYPPPPHQAPPTVPYGPSPPPPFPPGVTRPPPPPTPQGYSPAGYPPNPYPGGYQPPPPLPHYGQYPTPPPPPPQYAQQSPYGQPSYPAQYPPPPAGYYAPSAVPPPAPPPSSYPPGTYPPQQYGLPPPPPPPAPSSAAYSSHYPPQPPPPPPPPPPPGAFHYSPSQPPPYAPPQPQYTPPPGWAPSQAGPPLSANQTPLGAPRGRHQKHQGPKRPQHHRGKDRQASEKHGKGGSRHERRGRRSSRSEQHTRVDDPHETTDGVEKPNPAPEEVSGGKEGNGAPGWDPQIEEELRLVFPEIKTNPADPVGIPIPVEYSDDPTIPPAYNATCVKSEFFHEDNQKDFVRSIREHPSWPTLRDDPVFKHYPGMATRRFPDCEHEFPTYDPSERPPSSSAIKLPPPFRIDRPAKTTNRVGVDESWRDGRSNHAQTQSPRNRQHDDVGRDRFHGDDRDEPSRRKRSFDAGSENGRDDRGLKRSRRWSQHQRNRSLENHNRAISPRPRSISPPKFNLEVDPWSPQAGETNCKASDDRRHAGASIDAKHSPRREERMSYADKRHDSGYHSGQSLHKSAPRYRDDDRERRRSSDRSYRKRRSPSRSRSRSRGRYRSRSRATTPSRSARSRSESPLDDLEAGLLGLVRDSSEPESKPVPKKPIKRVKVAAAFGRRW
ncbi:uncharacterized protein B0H64DRAFT_183518 [Chaetomium fimeti]|uniref:CCHC-type domain-containing protein n=1 Tax=Chaetomium fimeti TaxID=1854472 RepID=A0AAE0LRK1_9PEZI|nr:hypothetical protein B0H64DRAFT_183518 [Chaetomium fimeti]